MSGANLKARPLPPQKVTAPGTPGTLPSTKSPSGVMLVAWGAAGRVSQPARDAFA